MNNLILIGLGGIAYYFYTQKKGNINGLNGVPAIIDREIKLQTFEPVELKLSGNTDGTFNVPIGIVKRYGVPDRVARNTLYIPPPIYTAEDPPARSLYGDPVNF